MHFAVSRHRQNSLGPAQCSEIVRTARPPPAPPTVRAAISPPGSFFVFLRNLAPPHMAAHAMEWGWPDAYEEGEADPHGHRHAEQSPDRHRHHLGRVRPVRGGGSSSPRPPVIALHPETPHGRMPMAERWSWRPRVAGRTGGGLAGARRPGLRPPPGGRERWQACAAGQSASATPPSQTRESSAATSCSVHLRTLSGGEYA
jgi:hypothetical protein